MIRKILLIAVSIVAIFGLLRAIDAIAAAYPPALGGTGTTASPAAGQVLIGTGSGAYTPAYILCAGTCSVSSASGTVTITGTGVATNTGNWAGTWQLYNPSDFLSSSTQVVNTVNGGSGTVTITSSTLGVVWPTINGNKAAAYQITAGTGATTTVSGATTTISVSLNNGVTQTCSANQFVNSVTSAGIASCGSVTFPTAPTYTSVAGSGISITQATSSTNTTTTVTLNINGGSVQNCSTGQLANSLSATGTITCQIAVQTIAGVNTSTISFVAGTGIGISTTTNSITLTNVGVTTSTGNWQGTWQGTNSTTYYLATNPSGYISSALQNASVTATSPITWSAASVIGCASCLTTSTASTTYVPYTGANSNVNLGSNNLAVGGTLNVTSTANFASTTTVGSQSAGANAYIDATRGSNIAPAIQTSSWTLQAEWSIAGGVLIAAAGSNQSAQPNPALSITAGVTYEVKMTIATSSQYGAYSIGGTGGASTLAGSSIDDYVTAQNTGNFIINSGGAALAITSVSVQPISNGNLSVDGSLSVKSETSFSNPVGFGAAPSSFLTAPVSINGPTAGYAMVIYRSGNSGQYLGFSGAAGNTYEIVGVGAKNFLIQNDSTGAGVNSGGIELATDNGSQVPLFLDTNGEVDVNGTTDSGNNLHVSGTGDFTSNLAVGTTTTSTATLNVVSATTSVATFVATGTTTSTVITGSASSTACHVMYASGAASSFDVVAGISYYFNTNNCS